MKPKLESPAPEFKGTAVFDGSFKEITLSEFKGKYLLLLFYPMDFTFLCPTELEKFSDRIREFREMNCEIVACSTDSHYNHLAWINTPRKFGGLGDFSFPLLSDKSMKICRDYEVLNEDTGVAYRALFIIDPKQIVKQITVNDDMVPRDVDEALRLVEICKFTDEHGEICPPNWKPSNKSMTSDSTKRGFDSYG